MCGAFDETHGAKHARLAVYCSFLSNYYSSHMKGGAFCSTGTVMTGIQTMFASTALSQSRPRKLISTPIGSEHRLTKWGENNALVGSGRLTQGECCFSSQLVGAAGFAS
jgi:hypothetical protein